MSSPVDQPTAKERDAAFEAFNRGDYATLEKYLKRSLAWNLEAARDTFDRDVYIAGRKSHGSDPSETEIKGAKNLTDNIRLTFKVDAARNANLLGKLLRIQFKYEQALVYLRQAAELDPSTTLYTMDVTMTEADIKRYST